MKPCDRFCYILALERRQVMFILCWKASSLSFISLSKVDRPKTKNLSFPLALSRETYEVSGELFYIVNCLKPFQCNTSSPLSLGVDCYVNLVKDVTSLVPQRFFDTWYVTISICFRPKQGIMCLMCYFLDYAFISRFTKGMLVFTINKIFEYKSKIMCALLLLFL